MRERGKKLIGIITPMWGRHEIFRIYSKAIQLLDGATEVYISGTGDIQTVSNGFNYVDCPNQPLSYKVNLAAWQAQYGSADVFLMLGSDDIVNQKLIDFYLKKIEEGYDYVFATDLYFYDTVSKRSLYWAGYRTEGKDSGFKDGDAGGPCRMLTRKVMEQLDWQPWGGYDDFLDTGFDIKINKLDIKRIGVSLKENGLFACDIKSDQNMTRFEKWDNAQFIDNSVIESEVPELFKMMQDI